jgi:hypothetical protein
VTSPSVFKNRSGFKLEIVIDGNGQISNELIISSALERERQKRQKEREG